LFRSFVNIITLLDKPVILFLDDIQWMNFECFELLKITIDTLKEHRFFLILSYRSEPVSVLNLVESKLKSSLNLINRQHVKLDFLSLSSIHSWLLDIVKQKCPDFISRLVQEETNGNPFIIKNFFRDLLAQRLFPFKNELSLTQWHIESEKFRLILRDTKFISNQFRSLPDDTKYLTKVILLYGKCCDLQTLHNILLHDVFEENLSVAVERGILLLSNKIYKIFHDKIAETILEQICDEEKADIHLKIGRYFIERLDAGMITDDLEYFEMLKHFNLGIQNASKDELKRLIELNIEGVYKSKNLAAFNIALQFISWAKESLVYIDVMDHELKYRVYKEYIECSYLEKHNEQAEIALNDIFSSCNNFQKAELLKLKLHKEFIIGNLKGALEIGLKALKLLGVNISPSPNKLKLFLLDRVLRYQLSKISIRELADCPQMKNNDNLYLIIRILSEITPIVYNLGNKRLLTLLVLEQLTMLLKHGQVPEASYIYVLYGLILIMKKKYAEGYKFGSLAVDLVNKPENLPYKSRVYFVFAMFILPWNDSWNKSKFFFEQAIKVGLQTGDFYYAACSCYPINALSPSLDLKTEIQQADKYIQIAKKINISSATERAILYQFYRCSLYSKNSKSKFIRKYHFNEKKILEQANQGNMIHTSIGTYYLNKLKLAFYDQNHKLSLSLIQKINASSSYFLGHIRDFEFSFFFFFMLYRYKCSIYKN
jgi:predicted ATPase